MFVIEFSGIDAMMMAVETGKLLIKLIIFINEQRFRKSNQRVY